MPKLKIAILFHKNSYRFRVDKYSIKFLSSVWESDGHEVIFVFGTDRLVTADICIVHVDLSVVPDEYLEFANCYPIVLNGAIKTIQKTHFSKNLVTAEDDYPGKVIVKSNDNYAGWPEILLTRNLISIMRARILSAFGSENNTYSSSLDYVIYDCLDEVPQQVFEDPYFAVEKFQPEIVDGVYFTNLYAFLGNSHQFFRESSLNPIVKHSHVLTSEEISPDPELIKIRQSMHFDYGKFDYCYHDGELVLFDINKTIGMGSMKYKSQYTARARALYDYFN